MADDGTKDVAATPPRGSTGTQATRSRSGCLTCRARKLRCDRNNADPTGLSCGRCTRLGVKCISSNNASLSSEERRQLQGDAARRHDLNEAGFTRLRTAASCRHCRSRRQKCSGDRPSCTRCVQSKQVCVYDRGKHETRASIVTPAASGPISHQSDGHSLQGLRKFQDKATVRSLVETFFREISPLRCFGFLHEPSFMLRMDYLFNNEDKDPLLMTVCALATRATNQEADIRAQGAAWAQYSLIMVRNQAHRISVNILMCLVLLHEYFVRVDEASQAFVLSALACRLCQALQLNVEYDEDFECRSSSLSATEKETRRRLMWACYLLDTTTCGHLDSIKMLREEDVKIQMPADEDSFFYRTAGMTSFLRPIGLLGHQEHLNTIDPNLGGYRAYYLHLVIIRERVLRYLKRRTQEENPSRPMSEYNLLASDLEQWRSALPSNLRLTPEIIYIRKSQGVLSALLDLHTGYHQCGCDLYRAMIPELQLPPKRQNNMTMTASPEFLADGKQKWFRHACEITQIFRLAMEHAPNSMTETNSAIHAYTAIRTKLYYSLYIMTDEERQIQTKYVEDSISTDLEYLRKLNDLHPMTARTLACAEELVRTLDPRSGGTSPAEEPSISMDTSADRTSPASSGGSHGGDGATVVVDLTATTRSSQPVPSGLDGYNAMSGRLNSASQVSADYILHPLALFRVLRSQLAEKHAPEKMQTNSMYFEGDDAVSPNLLGVAAPFLTIPAELTQQQQFSSAFWDLDENSFAWINADVQDNDFGLSTGWYSAGMS